MVRDEDEVAHRCVNPECPAQIRERLIWFAARGQMDIEGLGEKMVHQLADASSLRSFGDIYALRERREQIVQLDRMGERKVENLLRAIEESKRRGLHRILAGLGIRHVGARAAQIVAHHFRSIDKLLAASREEFETFEVDGEKSGIGPEIAESLHGFLQSAAGRHIIEELRVAGVDLTAPRRARAAPAESASPFAAKTIVITGTLDGVDRKELAERLEAQGAKVTSTVSKKTDLLIAGQNPGSKLDKAKKLGVEIWEQDKLREAMP